MKKSVLISSIFSSNTINPFLLKFSPSHLIVVVEKDLDKQQGKDFLIKKESIKKLKEDFGKLIQIEILETPSLYNLYEISKSLIKKIDSLDNSEIILNISEGRKSLSFGMYFASYLRKEKIKGVYYLIKEENQLLQMPFMNFEINDVKKEMLKNIESKHLNLDDLKKNIKKSKSVFYKYLKELEKDGYLSIEENIVKITDMGKILLL